jgi:hypothetical protein
MLDFREKVKDDELEMLHNTRGQLKVVLSARRGLSRSAGLLVNHVVTSCGEMCCKELGRQKSNTVLKST